MTQPASVPNDGNVKVAYVTTIANTAAPTVAELTAGSTKDLSCYLTAEGLTPGTDEQVTPDDRLCSRQTFERRGRFTNTMEIGYVHNPTSAPNNVAYTTLDPGVSGYLVVRWGTAYETAFAAGDIVDVYPITAGEQRKSPPTANSVLTAMQKLFVTNTVQKDVTVA